MNSHTTVRSKFLVGPLTLKVEKEVSTIEADFTSINYSLVKFNYSLFRQFGRGAKKELRSATATTAEMFGKLHLKVVHGGDASLNSIKVMQPKQVRNFKQIPSNKYPRKYFFTRTLFSR